MRNISGFNIPCKCCLGTTAAAVCALTADNYIQIRRKADELCKVLAPFVGQNINMTVLSERIVSIAFLVTHFRILSLEGRLSMTFAMSIVTPAFLKKAPITNGITLANPKYPAARYQ